MRVRMKYLVAGVIAFVLAMQVAVQAQQPRPCDVFGCPSPTPTPVPGGPTPEPTDTPATTPTTTAKPRPKQTLPPIPGTTTAAPKKTTTPTPTATGTPGFDGINGNSNLPPDLRKGFDIMVPDIPRTLPNNSAKLVELLEPLTELGLPLQQVLIEGMGRFPIAGLAYWHDDWLEPRFTPVPHLHHGLDLFADFGTPIRAVDNGTVTFLNDPAGWGNGVDLHTKDGYDYIFAHMQSIAAGLKPGDSVKLGDVIGYVGNTGNAAGGPPHCHFEVHHPDAQPPKPLVDRWLADAIKAAPRWVEMRRRQILGIEGGSDVTARSDAVPQLPKDSLDASMVATLLDPVGGSVGLLPKLQLERQKRPEVSDALLLQIIRDRVGGYLFAPPATVGHLAD